MSHLQVEKLLEAASPRGQAGRAEFEGRHYDTTAHCISSVSIGQLTRGLQGWHTPTLFFCATPGSASLQGRPTGVRPQLQTVAGAGLPPEPDPSDWPRLACYHDPVRIYLDYNATAPVLPAVAAAVTRVMTETIGNASSVHAFGQQAKAEVDRARQAVAALLGADASEVVFTSGGTEADNLAIRGAAEALEPAGRRHLVTTAHRARGRAQHRSRRSSGAAGRTTIVPVGPAGIVAPDAVAGGDSTRHGARVGHARQQRDRHRSSRSPRSRRSRARAACSFTPTPCSRSARFRSPSARSASTCCRSSAHKFGGPKGVGALWIRRGVRLVSQPTGGRQERNRRAGTENVPALAGLGVAARRRARRSVADAMRLAALRDRLEAAILATCPEPTSTATGATRVPNTTNISFDGIEAESLLIALDLEGIAVSTGSACSSGTLEPSHVLRAMGLPHARARNSLRFSLGPATTDRRDRLLSLGVLPGLVARLRTLGRPAAAAR